MFERVLLSPWINGTHHGRIEPRHLQAYLNEFVFRFNRRFYPMNSRYYGADATRISRRPAPAFGAWLSLTLYPHFATSALKSAATFMTSKNRSRVSGQISQTWMPRSSCFRLAQILMPIPPKRAYRRTRYFAHNELSRLTQDALRTASGPLTSAQIAVAVMQAKGMPPGDVAFKEIVAARVVTVLRRLAKRGGVAKSGTSRNADK